jgi:hypothetical protein
MIYVFNPDQLSRSISIILGGQTHPSLMLTEECSGLFSFLKSSSLDIFSRPIAFVKPQTKTIYLFDGL